MSDEISNIGDEVYRTWSDEQRRHEIGNLVQGFKNGLPIQILCQLATAIAGTPALACQHISAFLPQEEREALVEKESGTNVQLRGLLESTLL